MDLYEIIAGISIILSLIYVFRWNHRYSIFFTLIFMIIPVSSLGYTILNKSTALSMALLGNNVTYFGGCYLLLIITFNIFELCKWKVKHWIKNLMFFTNTIVYLCVLTSGHLDLFYKSVVFNPDGTGPSKLIKEYGIMHTVYYVLIALYFILCLVAIIKGFRNSSAVSKNTVSLLLLTMCVTIVVYTCKSIFSFFGILIPLSYVLAQVIFLLIADRLVLYDVEHAVIDVSVQRGQIATISFDKKRNFLGSNDVAKLFFSELQGIQIDRPVAVKIGILKKIDDWIDDVIMAIFGAPMPVKNHELDAYLAAKEMREELKELNKKFVQENLPEIHFGIGLHSGTVLAGTIGAASRMEYTVIGDVVNTASRIEGLCKQYRKDLLISEACYNAISEADKNIKLNFVTETEIRGREQKVKLYTD